MVNKNKKEAARVIKVKVILVCLVIVGLTFCEKEPTKPEEVTKEQPISETTQTIGPEGGILEFENPENPLYGARLSIPQGALEYEMEQFMERHG